MASQLPATLFEHNNGADADFPLNLGAPGAATLRKCAQLMRTAALERLADEAAADGKLLQYGPPSGDPRFLTHLAEFLSQGYGEPVDINDLSATPGASGGLVYLLTLLFPQKCPVFCEKFSYMDAVEVFKELGYPKISVQIDSDGVNLESLRAAFEDGKQKFGKNVNKFGFWGLYYTIPTFHNPTGCVLSPEKSRQVIKLAREYGILVICDDVYNLLNYTGTHSPRRLYSYDQRSDADFKGNVVSNGSFSKLLSPGIRLGWLEMPPWLKQLWDSSATLDSGGCLNMFCSGIIAIALQSGAVKQFVADVRELYAERLKGIDQILKECLPAKASYRLPEGGYFLWIKLPDGSDSKAIFEEAKKRHRLRFQPGTRFWVGDESDNQGCNYIRLSIAYCENEILFEGVRRLCSLLEDLL